MFLTHGLRWHPLYIVWYHMLARCYDPEHPSYCDYGKRGIRVERRWHDVALFIEDAKDWRKGLSIDRIDNDGNYTRRNTRWSTHKQQNNNKRDNVRVEFNGITKTVAEWADGFGISHPAMAKRLRKWSLERAMTQPKSIEMCRRK